MNRREIVLITFCVSEEREGEFEILWIKGQHPTLLRTSQNCNALFSAEWCGWFGHAATPLLCQSR